MGFSLVDQPETNGAAKPVKRAQRTQRVAVLQAKRGVQGKPSSTKSPRRTPVPNAVVLRAVSVMISRP